jgi:hypothetical protein
VQPDPSVPGSAERQQRRASILAWILHQPLEGTEAGELQFGCRHSRFSKIIWLIKRICRPGDAFQRGIGNVIVARADDGLGQDFAASCPPPRTTPRTSGLSLIDVPRRDLLSSMVPRNGCWNTGSRLCETWRGHGPAMSSWTSVAATVITSSPLDLKSFVASGLISRRP